MRVGSRKLVRGTWYHTYDQKASTTACSCSYPLIPGSSCKNRRVSRKRRDLVRRRSQSLPVLCRVQARYMTRRRQAVPHFSEKVRRPINRRVSLWTIDLSDGVAAGSYRAIAKALCSSSSISPMHTWRVAGRVVADMVDLLGSLNELARPASEPSLP